MRRVPLLILCIAAAAAAGLVSGCNQRLDDPTTSEGILTIEKVEPVNVEADVTPTDPNGNPQTLSNDSTTVTLKNRPRTKNTGPFTDILVKKTDQFCTFAGATITSGTGLASFTIPTNGTASVSVVVVTVTEKTTLASVGDSWKCYIRFEGEDLAGNPATTDYASVVVNFVDG
ncbi:MAG TPA: hypothetical protein VNI57_14625 [Candidatus Saccharimonadales bacterium]|nr:hypothetical protein [Candidatus Saccharimonadales bacterium]